MPHEQAQDPVAVVQGLIECAHLVQVEDVSSDAGTLQASMAERGMSLPCILKPLLACGPQWAHDLAIIRNWNALGHAQVSACLPTPCRVRPLVCMSLLRHSKACRQDLSKLYHTHC